MPNTYVALATQTLSSTASSVTFSSISQGYTDLVIIISGNGASTQSYQLQFNGEVTGTNYSLTYLLGDGSAASSGRQTNQAYMNAIGRQGTGSEFGTSLINLQNYSNTSTFKTVIARGGVASALTIATVGLWRNTAAISTILITPESGGNINSGSTFSLYGIANADQGSAKATGGMITEDSTYWYHTFGATGAFIPKQSLTCDVLMIAGGGGSASGGGGAGGLVGLSSQSLTASTYTIAIGGGGSTSTNGTNTTFTGLTTALGGGYGGADSTAVPAGSGGSGGGGGASGLQTTVAGTGSQGNNGGTNGGILASPYPAGGGGGAGAAGGNATSSTVSGVGGNGSTAYSSWGLATGTGQNVNGTVYYAGGGSGAVYSAGGTTGAAGLGGGGKGSSGATAATGGSPNTGGGAGGIGQGGTGANGGSGIVIVRYAK